MHILLGGPALEPGGGYCAAAGAKLVPGNHLQGGGKQGAGVSGVSARAVHAGNTWGTLHLRCCGWTHTEALSNHHACMEAGRQAGAFTCLALGVCVAQLGQLSRVAIVLALLVRHSGDGACRSLQKGTYYCLMHLTAGPIHSLSGTAEMVPAEVCRRGNIVV